MTAPSHPCPKILGKVIAWAGQYRLITTCHISGGCVSVGTGDGLNLILNKATISDALIEDRGIFRAMCQEDFPEGTFK